MGDNLGRYHSWSYASGLLHYKVVTIQFDFDRGFVQYPFMFNLVWLEEEEFKVLVHEKMKSFSLPIQSSPMQNFVTKLSLLREEVKIWEKEKKVSNEKLLNEIDTKIQELATIVDEDLFSSERK